MVFKSDRQRKAMWARQRRQIRTLSGRKRDIYFVEIGVRGKSHGEAMRIVRGNTSKYWHPTMMSLIRKR